MSDKVRFKDKVKTYYSYNKHKLPIIFAFVGLFFLTAFPGVHYADNVITKVPSKFNAFSLFAIMILALVQVVNAITLSAKNNKKTEIISTVLFTALNLLTLFFAYIYIGGYIKHGYQPAFLKPILMISIGVLFNLIANVFAFIYLGYDTKKSLNEIIKQLEAEELEENEAK